MSKRLRALQARSQRIAVLQPVYRLCCAAWVRIGTDRSSPLPR